MAKKQAVNKTQAVRDYLKSHPSAKSKEIAAALAKAGIKITPGHVSNIKSKTKKTGKAKKVVPAKPAPAPALEPVAEKPVKAADTVTLQQIKAVVQTIKSVGGVDRLNELLGLVKEVGGLKKFKDLLEAMSVTDADRIPY